MGADLSKKEKVQVFYSCLKRGGFRLSISTFIHYVRRFFFSILRVQSVLMAHARSYYKQCIQALHEKRLVHIRETIFVT